MYRYLSLFLMLFITVPAFAEGQARTEEQKTFYAIGLALAKNVAVFNLTKEEAAIVAQGFVDATTGRELEVQLLSYNEKIQQLARDRRKAAGEKQAASGVALVDKAAAEKGAVKKPSGMVYVPITEGKGDSPGATDRVKVNYRGTLVDGREFDSSYKRNKPIEFRLDGVIKCWTEGLQMMKPGGKAKLICPAATAYGDNGAGEMILPGATLQFEVELLEVAGK